jgi:hypothetical protein
VKGYARISDHSSCPTRSNHTRWIEILWVQPFPDPIQGLVRLIPLPMDWMGLEKIKKGFDLVGIQTYPIPLNPCGLEANRTSPNRGRPHRDRRPICCLLCGATCRHAFLEMRASTTAGSASSRTPSFAPATAS